jgi:hypothetical protein
MSAHYDLILLSNNERTEMSDCTFCGLPSEELVLVVNQSVCFECADLAELASEAEEVEL